MPYLYRRPRSPYVWCRGTLPDGKPWYASTKCRDDDSARKAARDIERQRVAEFCEQQKTKAARADAEKVITLREALAVLRQHKLRKRVSDATMVKFEWKTKPLERLFGSDRDVASLTLADLEAYVDRRRAEVVRGTTRNVKDHTIAMELGALCSALYQLKRHGLYAGEPRAIWPEALTNTYTPRTRWLPLEEFRRLIVAIHPEKRKYIIAYAHTGVRLSELYRAERRGNVLVVDQRKGEKQMRLVPLSAELKEILDRDPLPWVRWHKNSMMNALNSAADRAGIARLSCNDLRRTFASWLCNAGVPELTVIRLMGHRTSKMIRDVYAQLSPQTLEEAVSRLPRIRSVTTGVTDAADMGGSVDTVESHR